jgi:hypothetical protein
VANDAEHRAESAGGNEIPDKPDFARQLPDGVHLVLPKKKGKRRGPVPDSVVQ